MNEVIIGQRRQGKSTLALTVAATKSDWIVVFDPNHNYRIPGILAVKSPTHLMEVFDRADEMPPVLVMRIGPFERDDLEQAFDVYSEVLWRYDGYSLIVDESHMLQTKMRVNNSLDRFLRRSPADTHVIQTAHRLMELNDLSRYLIDDLRMFRNEAPRELAFIEDRFPGLTSEMVKGLGDREHVRWYREGAGGIRYYIQRDTGSWFIDLHNPNKRREQ